jgi:hypothetical protein
MEVYVWFNGGDPEHMVIFLSKEEAIDASLKYPSAIFSIFNKTKFGYQMTYDYYKNGKLYN